MTAPAPIKLKIQLMCGAEIAMGPGKADLLAAIEVTGSISAAGRRLGLSYRKVRLMLDTMNRCFRAPLVEAVKGGARGGGASLTDLGREALRSYQQIQARAQAAVNRELQAYLKLLAETPRD